MLGARVSIDKMFLANLQRPLYVPVRSFVAHVDSLHRVYGNPCSKHVRFNLGLAVTPKVFAASSATKEEVELGKKLRASGADQTRPVETSRKIWRPQVTSEYKEPDCIPDPTSDLEILFKDYGKPLWINKTKLPPRDDIIKYIPTKHDSEIKRNLQWADCPSEHRPTIENLVKEYWDVFAEEGVRKQHL